MAKVHGGLADLGGMVEVHSGLRCMMVWQSSQNGGGAKSSSREKGQVFGRMGHPSVAEGGKNVGQRKRAGKRAKENARGEDPRSDGAGLSRGRSSEAKLGI